MAATAILFPGQGSHEPGMDEPHRRSALLARGLERLGDDPFARLDEGTRWQQPALFLACAAAWDAARPDAMGAAGHSLGEYAALFAAGALSFDDALELVDVRARAMAAAGQAQPGGMVAMLGGEEAAVRELAEAHGLTVANDNAPGQLVLSGRIEAVRGAEAAARDAGTRARVLPVSGAFHSPLMEPAADALRAALADVEVGEPDFPVWSNGTAAPFADVREELAANLLRPVRWRETVLALRDAGATDFQELGPGRVLTGMVKRTVRG
ncbi:MAG: [acyl-carrier-protein] S-malonyltransferase [Solirubrobacteraceae bacterium]|jgi:malonyl CoA-acyl carrier protein transacylase|nr:[acyl-carrier-protein] S-malonyltransferase [Solirubrobacteraceae bacterium]